MTSTTSADPEVSRQSRVNKVLRVLTALVAVGQIFLFAISSLGRASYPFPLDNLDNMEGNMALSVARVAQGLPLYVPPNFHFIPFMYSPGYIYAAAFAMKLLGPGFYALRIVSFLSTVGCLIVIAAFIYTETKDSLASLAGAGLYASAYPLTNFWFDRGRVDSFYVLLILLALYATRRFNPVVAGIVWTLALLAKQSIAPVALVMLCFDYLRPRRIVAGVGTFLLTSAFSMAWLNHVTHGWFNYYVFTIPRVNSDIERHWAFYYPSAYLLAPFGLALLVIAVSILFVRVNWRSSVAQFYALAIAITTVLCWFIKMHLGSLVNSDMPVYAVLAVAFGIAIARLASWLTSQGHTGQIALSLLLLACCVQLAGRIYSPRDVIPSKAIRASQAQSIEWLKSFPGDVFVPSHPYEAMLAGKQHPDAAAMRDALRTGQPDANGGLLQEIKSAITRESLDAIVIDSPPETAGLPDYYDMWMPKDWKEHYPVVGAVLNFDQTSAIVTKPAHYVLLPCRSLHTVAASKIYILNPEACSSK